MQIVVGSKNPTKLDAVQDVFKTATITSLAVPSNVSSQPFSDEETRTGAINRAVQCAKSTVNAAGIGLEGGVMDMDGQLYLCNWGALVTPDQQLYTASGARILLLKDIESQLKSGKDLGDVMDNYVLRKEVSKKEGAIGIFTNNLITRKEMFKHVVLLLKGQWEYWQ